MIRFQTLGTLEVTMDGAEAPSQLLWKKNIALLLYLARSPKRRCTREQLIGLLWPDKDDGAARQSVREAIRVLRQYVGEDRLKATGDVVQLLDGAVERSDSMRATSSVRTGRLAGPARWTRCHSAPCAGTCVVSREQVIGQAPCSCSTGS